MEIIGKIPGFLFPIFSIHFQRALDNWKLCAVYNSRNLLESLQFAIVFLSQLKVFSPTK